MTVLLLLPPPSPSVFRVMTMMMMITVYSSRLVSVAAFSPSFRRSIIPTTTVLQGHSSRRFSATTLRAQDIGSDSVSSSSTAATSNTNNPPIPMTLLSGFLGTGKTSALKHLLENSANQLKIGVVVNDVAEVNIDAKLVAATQGDMVELQNGCACCSLADELFTSVEKLVKKRKLDAIVVELSGVADPMAIKSNWRVAAPPHIRQLADIKRVVTLVDANTFGTDYMTWDMARERKGWVPEQDDCAGTRKVSELLAEQVEAADLILINKVDIATKEEVEIATAVAKALNDKAQVQKVEFGRVSPLDLIHVDEKKKEEEVPKKKKKDHDHKHEHHHAAEACKDPDCSDPSHSHDHSHEHDHNHHSSEEACHDPGCTDPNHSHDHSHSHSTSTDQLGISSFVYRASVPFDGRKLMEILNLWPVPKKKVLDVELLQEAAKEGYEIGGRKARESPFVGVLRSKGFCWFAPSQWSGRNEDVWRHDTAMYWSHAGKHFSVTAAGKWWGTIQSRDQMKRYFENNMEEYERILREDFVTDEFADRRQELVFIGTNLDKDKITATLNDCLLTEKQMQVYRQKLQNYLASLLTTSSAPPGLFDVGGIDHMDLEK